MLSLETAWPNTNQNWASLCESCDGGTAKFYKTIAVFKSTQLYLIATSTIVALNISE